MSALGLVPNLVELEPDSVHDNGGDGLLHVHLDHHLAIEALLDKVRAQMHPVTVRHHHRAQLGDVHRWRAGGRSAAAEEAGEHVEGKREEDKKSQQK